MKFAIFALIATLAPSFSQASTLTYKIDLDHSKMDEITAFDICGLPKEFSLNANDDLATVVIKETRSVNPEILTIQRSTGSMGGGGVKEPFTGDYRTRVMITKQKSESYKYGIYERVEVITFGNKAAPKAFTVVADLLNYHESAELAEGSICTGYAYTLK